MKPTRHRGAHPSEVRRHNLGLVLTSLAVPGTSRAAIAARTGLTKASVTSLVDELMALGLVDEADTEPARGAGPGRPSAALRVHRAAPHAVGLDLGVHTITAVRTDLAGVVLEERRIPLSGHGLDAVVTSLAAAWRSIATEGPLAGTGVAVPGVVARDGRLLRAPNLPALAGADLAAELAAVLPPQGPGRGVLVDNEANLSALAELDAGEAGHDFVVVTAEVGVGAGVVIDGELFRGAGGLAGELGHVPVHADGHPCGCGGRGCVEQYAGEAALLRESGAADVDALVAAVERGDERALRAVHDAGRHLGVALAALVNVLDVGTLVLGGTYALVLDALAPAVQLELATRVVAGRARPLQVRPAVVGTDAAARGAASMAVRAAIASGVLWR